MTTTGRGNVIDVAASVAVAAQPADVAGVLFDPARETDWVPALVSVEIVDPALVPGARVRRRATVLGRETEWLTEVEAARFPHLLRLRIREGPMQGVVQYEVQRSGTGSHVAIRFAFESPADLPAAAIAGPLERELERALERLKAVIER
jgi:hypothetical protein